MGFSHINMTCGALAKYDWRRRLRGGGPGHYKESVAQIA